MRSRPRGRQKLTPVVGGLSAVLRLRERPLFSGVSVRPVSEESTSPANIVNPCAVLIAARGASVNIAVLLLVRARRRCWRQRCRS